MFLFNTLKFQPERFSGDYIAITDGKEYRTLLLGEFDADKDGALTNTPALAVFRTTAMAETDESFIGHEVLPNGAVKPETTVFPKSVWKLALSRKDAALGIHIPSKMEYSPAEHRKSILMALDFYREFYPDMDFKAIVCYSWLYSPQNKHLFPEGSRILEIEKCVHLCPIASTVDENLMFIRKGSSLQTRMAEYRAAGNEYHVGYMYSPLEEAVEFGKYKHEL